MSEQKDFTIPELVHFLHHTRADWDCEEWADLENRVKSLSAFREWIERESQFWEARSKNASVSEDARKEAWAKFDILRHCISKINPLLL